MRVSVGGEDNSLNSHASHRSCRSSSLFVKQSQHFGSNQLPVSNINSLNVGKKKTKAAAAVDKKIIIKITEKRSKFKRD